MPDTLLDSRSVFDSQKAILGHWLRDHTATVRGLPRNTLHTYPGHNFVAGWQITTEHSGVDLTFHILLDGQFPYSAIRIAFKSQDVYLKWPHVEPHGLLCLRRVRAPAAALEDAIVATLSDALALVDECQDPKFADKEFRHEFLSYWNRSAHEDEKPVFSLLDVTDKKPRQVAVWHGRFYTLVGETADQVRSRLKNGGKTDTSTIITGIFGFLDDAPAPPFLDRVSELCVLLKQHCPSALALFDQLPIEQNITIVLGAPSPTGDGLIGVTVVAPNMNGFRKGGGLTAATKMALWKMKSRLRRVEIKRFDAAWVHGRGLNKQLPKLQAATALVLGCGSLGSHVVEQLARCGIGRLILVDPQRLEAANVGRHALGIDSVGGFKATELAKEQRRRFPHIRDVEAHELTWQELYEKSPRLFETSNLIVSCLGEWAGDGQLGEWQVNKKDAPPVVYGWLDERGVAAHALALAGQSPTLSSVLDPDGQLRTAETEWEGDNLIKAEPACGTLFQPYGAIDVAHAEALVSRLCLDLLVGTANAPVHRVYAGSTAQLKEAGGAWSAEHLKHRPKGFDGAFEYERPLALYQDCEAA
jgi:sulfur-carrier protein adenylyltransferase/sulfurtransferase